MSLTTTRPPRMIEVGTVEAIPGRSRATREVWTRSHYRTPITLGVLDDDARFAYTGGQCHALAAALAEHTGWPIVVIVRGVDSDHHCEELVHHCLVAIPDGRWLDVNGPHEPAYWLDESDLEDTEYQQVSRTDVDGVLALATRAGMLGDFTMLPANLRAARALVPAVLALLEN